MFGESYVLFFVFLGTEQKSHQSILIDGIHYGYAATTYGV
jgi:hypothetical protein